MRYFFLKAGQEQISITDTNLTKFTKKELKQKIKFITAIKNEIPIELKKDLNNIYKKFTDKLIIENKIKKLKNEYTKLEKLLDYFLIQLQRNL